METEREPRRMTRDAPWLVATALAAVLGLGLAADAALRSSATYDEVAYLRIGARWWRGVGQDQMTRMGSPLTFWKWQQAPTLWAIDRAGFGELIDEPIRHQRALLPLIRLGATPIWLLALGLTATWARLQHGPRAMAMAAALFALGPNLLAHGGLATMEMPLTACAAGAFLLFWRFLRGGRKADFLGSAAACGLAFSCKFTAILFPPILATAWLIDRVRRGDRPLARLLLRVVAAMAAFGAVMLGTDLIVTGFRTAPISERTGDHPSVNPTFPRLARLAIETPIPSDLAGFAIQVKHQKTGGRSYLFGDRRAHGWRHYYLIALAVKVPLAFWFLMGCRALTTRKGFAAGDALIPTILAGFLAVASLASTRNYGIRYLLPMAPPAIVWVSRLAEGGFWPRRAAMAGMAGMAVSLGMIHPHELSYFNVLAGGPIGGRRILSDSCLDWGQGARSLARLQARHPEFRDLTFYAFGDTGENDSNPAFYGVVGRCLVIDAGDVHPGLPPTLQADSRYLAVSASLQWGPWGPPGYFRALEGVRPVALTDDWTIAVYRTADLPGAVNRRPR